MRIIAGLGLTLLVISTSACGGAETAPSPAAVSAEFAAAFNAHDATRAASFYTDDGELISPDAPPVKGRAAIEAVLTESLGEGCALELRSFESGASGDLGFDAGAFILTMPVDGGSETFTGRYLATFTRTGNDWKMAHHMLTLDQ